MYFSGVYFGSTGIQGEGAYRTLRITTFKNTGWFSYQATSYFYLDKQIHLENSDRCTSDTFLLLHFALS